MTWTRRQFLKGLAGGLAAMGLPVPAYIIPRREPYVTTRDLVSHIGRCPGGFIGARIVRSVGEWDGVGYPVTVDCNQWPKAEEVYYDHDLADFNREVPEGFWRIPENRERYPNVHTYVRMKRYGETREQAIRHLNFRGIRA